MIRPDTELQVVGVMSGTSLDGIDCALCACGPDSVRRVRQWSRPFPRSVWNRLQAAAAGAASVWEAARLHHYLGRLYARVVADGLGGLRPDAVGLHGQTVFHQPPPGRPATLQLGEPSYLAETLGVPVVSNFRAADLAAGGQGAPLATAFHRTVFAAPGEWVGVNNLGGISNVTALDWTGKGASPVVTAFDTGPANVLLDLAVRTWTGGRRRFDRDGRMAAAGKVDEALLARWQRHPYLRRKPPKSTGRELFGECFWEDHLVPGLGGRVPSAGRRADIVATLAEFTAGSVADAYRRHLPGFRSADRPRVVLVGGGAANPDLVGRIRRCLLAVNPGVEIVTGEAFGWPSNTVEPAAFALLAAWRLLGKPGNLPETTGARHPVLLGQVTRGGQR